MKNALIVVLGLLFTSGLQARTVADCIADFEAAKALYDTSSTDGGAHCVTQKVLLNYFAYASAPAKCDGEDEWQLEARAVKGKDKGKSKSKSTVGTCRVMLRGSAGNGCGTEEIVRELDDSEFGRWHGFLTKECASARRKPRT